MIKWQEPPVDKRKNWDEIRESLKQNPMQWALVAERTRNNKPYGINRPNFEVRTKLVCPNPRTFDIYARYVPPPKAPERGPTSKTLQQYRMEDIEDLLNFGATFEEIIERSAYNSWEYMRRALRCADRLDLLERMKEKKRAA